VRLLCAASELATKDKESGCAKGNVTPEVIDRTVVPLALFGRDLSTQFERISGEVVVLQARSRRGAHQEVRSTSWDQTRLPLHGYNESAFDPSRRGVAEPG
jgi:hypothetical protein